MISLHQHHALFEQHSRLYQLSAQLVRVSKLPAKTLLLQIYYSSLLSIQLS